MKRLRQLHKWPSLIVGLFVILFCFSGVVMNHRQYFSSYNFPRNLMPPDYQYRNWNLAAVKGILPLNDNELLAYGNIGIWKTNRDFSDFTNFSQGFPKGIDHRKIFTMIKTSDGSLFAGTLFGLYKYNSLKATWQQFDIPVRNPRTVKLLEREGKLIILTRSEMLAMPLKGPASFEVIQVPAVPDHVGKSSLFRTLWVIHSGEILGLTGKILVDLVGLSVIFIVLSGFYYTLLPKFIKRFNEPNRKRLRSLNRKTINWHTVIGVYGLPIFLITALTGMFLRPPLLIPIADKQVTSIPGTELAHQNHWFKKFRDVIYDTTNGNYIISTTEGLIKLDVGTKTNKTSYIRVQPPVSVMGMTAFEDLGYGNFMVASFSGIYRWNPSQERVTDLITGLPVLSHSEGNPFGAVAVSGVYMKDNLPAAIFDYEGGWINYTPGIKPEMPVQISSLPVSLWNLSLEIHTGRIFQSMIGLFYILYVPLMGLSILLILLTGLWMWNKTRKRKSKKALDEVKVDNP